MSKKFYLMPLCLSMSLFQVACGDDTTKNPQTETIKQPTKQQQQEEDERNTRDLMSTLNELVTIDDATLYSVKLSHALKKYNELTDKDKGAQDVSKLLYDKDSKKLFGDMYKRLGALEKKRLGAALFNTSLDKAKTAAAAAAAPGDVETAPDVVKLLEIDQGWIPNISEPQFSSDNKNSLELVAESMKGASFTDPKNMKLFELLVAKLNAKIVAQGSDWPSFSSDALDVVKTSEGLNSEVKARKALLLPVTAAALLADADVWNADLDPELDAFLALAGADPAAQKTAMANFAADDMLAPKVADWAFMNNAKEAFNDFISQPGALKDEISEALMAKASKASLTGADLKNFIQNTIGNAATKWNIDLVAGLKGLATRWVAGMPDKAEIVATIIAPGAIMDEEEEIKLLYFIYHGDPAESIATTDAAAPQREQLFSVCQDIQTPSCARLYARLDAGVKKEFLAWGLDDAGRAPAVKAVMTADNAVVPAVEKESAKDHLYGLALQADIDWAYGRASANVNAGFAAQKVARLTANNGGDYGIKLALADEFFTHGGASGSLLWKLGHMLLDKRAAEGGFWTNALGGDNRKNRMNALTKNVATAVNGTFANRVADWDNYIDAAGTDGRTSIDLLMDIVGGVDRTQLVTSLVDAKAFLLHTP